MSGTMLIRFFRSPWKRGLYLFLPGIIVVLIVLARFAKPLDDPQLKVLRMGLGSGTVSSSPTGIDCGATCEAGFATGASVTLTATADAGSTFVGWDVDPDGDSGTVADCTGTSSTCTLSMSVARSVRPVFDLSPAIPTMTDFTPAGIQTYLTANPTVNTAARFVKALPDEYKLNWILMSRSESLQTGTAEFPRILLPNANSQSVFSLGLAQHSSYPASHPNAIEYMQWDPSQKNFRFHEIVVDSIPALDPDGDGVGVIPPRSRGVSIDDAKCPRCHSTRNVLNHGSTAGTDGIPPGTVKVKNKPNWDAYDSWGGMIPFNRDRIYQGSIEAAALRKILNPWTWSTNESVRSIFEQLKLQPAGISAAHAITRLKGGTSDGFIKFAFDATTPVLTEPAPAGPSSTPVTYSFNQVAGMPPGTSVTQGGSFITLHHSEIPTSDEGRGVHFFDELGGLAGNLNQERIADELINHRFATGGVPIDIRPLAMAITSGCVLRDSGTNTVTSTAATPLSGLAFFNSRNGLTINDVYADTERRAVSTMPESRSRILPRRKADIEKLNVDRTGDIYLWGNPSPSPPVNGLIQQYGSTTSAGTDASLTRLRQEVFRRPTSPGVCPGVLCPDSTVMNGVYVDREDYSSNTEKIALYRYFLEPLGVSVDKWSMNVRGRSRSYNFADVFGFYLNVFTGDLRTSLLSNPVPGVTNPDDCNQLVIATNNMISSLPPANAIPPYTDVQRIFNKSCVECHGALDYPPYQNYGSALDLTENENPPAGQDRLDRSYGILASQGLIGANAASSFLYQRITATTENCPYGLMPCGGPPLSRVDIETIRRWLDGGAPQTRGDPHIVTVDGVPYDFQSAGEFTLLRGQGLEIQTRQTPVTTSGPLPPNAHTGLSSCVSINTAAAVRVGPHRITYQPNLSGEPDPQGVQLRVDGKLTNIGSEAINFDSGGRIIRTTAPDGIHGIQIEAPGGTVVDITPNWWPSYQVWYLDVDAYHARATQGIMGIIAPGNWLPSLPDGGLLGPIPPRDLHQRYVDLYDKFANAWRVTDANSLFDYAPGTSTATFTVASWPAENPKICTAPPRQPGGPVEKEPLKGLALEVAQQHCGPIVGNNAKTNCVQDVMVTGEPVFAQGYFRAEEIERHVPPAAPDLGFPERFKTGLAAPVDFTWGRTSALSGEPLTYRHCVWQVTEPFNFNKCVVTEASGQRTSSIRGGIFYGLLVLLLGIILLLILLWVGPKKKPVLLYSLLVVILIGVVIAFYLGRRRSQIGSATLARNVSGLQSSKAYYWKVIVEDGKGGSSESETRRFEIK